MNDLMYSVFIVCGSDSRLIAAAYAAADRAGSGWWHRRPDSEILPPVGETGKVVLADINESMLKMDARSCVISV